MAVAASVAHCGGNAARRDASAMSRRIFRVWARDGDAIDALQGIRPSCLPVPDYGTAGARFGSAYGKHSDLRNFGEVTAKQTT